MSRPKGVYDEDVPGEEDCGEQQHHVRQGDGSESVGDAQQVEADNGDGDADDDAEVHSSTQYDEGSSGVMTMYRAVMKPDRPADPE